MIQPQHNRNVSDRRWLVWEPPKVQTVKLNTDSESGRAYAGKVIRSDTGRWIKGYGSNSGYCSALEVELWAVSNGINLLVQLGIQKSVIECDSSEVLVLTLGLEFSKVNVII